MLSIQKQKKKQIVNKKSNKTKTDIFKILSLIFFGISCSMTTITYVFNEQLCSFTNNIYYTVVDTIVLLLLCVSFVLYLYFEKHEK